MDNIERNKKIIERRNLHNNKACARCKKVYYPAFMFFDRLGTNPSGLFKFATICNPCVVREEEIITNYEMGIKNVGVYI